jgi:plasmid maintenance system killer protein
MDKPVFMILNNEENSRINLNQVNVYEIVSDDDENSISIMVRNETLIYAYKNKASRDADVKKLDAYFSPMRGAE